MEKKIKTDEEETRSSSGSDSSPSPYSVATPSQMCFSLALGTDGNLRMQDAHRRVFLGRVKTELKKRELGRKEK